MYCLFYVVLCIFCVCMCAVLLPPGGYPIAVKYIVYHIDRLRWSRGSVLAFGTQVRGFKPGRSRRIFKGEKIFSTPSFGGEVEFLDEICRNISRPRRVPPSAARGLSRLWTWRHLAEKVGTSKGGGKQWQPTPKNLPRMQCARAIPVAWLGSGSC